MAFLEPQIEFGEWYVIDGPMGTEYVPADLVALDVSGMRHECKSISGENWAGYEYPDGAFPIPDELRDYCENREFWSIEKREAYGARLSAPGYLDCTDWALFDTEDEAQAYLDDETADEDEDETE